MTALPDPGRFHDGRPRDLHGDVPRWHRLAFIVVRLRQRIEALSGELRVGSGSRVLDFGCADLPYRHCFPADAEYLAADIAGNPKATVEVGADGTLPVPSESVDAVLSTQVLEHVEDPARYLAEAARVLRPGGRLLLTTHGMMFFHPDPVDLWRWTGTGLERQVEAAGLRVVHREGIMGMAATGAQMIQEGFYHRLPRVLRAPLAFVFQSLASLLDRLDSREGREMNAMVFAVVAEKP